MHCLSPLKGQFRKLLLLLSHYIGSPSPLLGIRCIHQGNMALFQLILFQIPVLKQRAPPEVLRSILTQPAASGNGLLSESEERSGDDTVLISDEISVISSYGEPFLTLTNLYNNSRTEPICDLLFWSRIIKLVLIHYLLFKFFLVPS